MMDVAKHDTPRLAPRRFDYTPAAEKRLPPTHSLSGKDDAHPQKSVSFGPAIAARSAVYSPSFAAEFSRKRFPSRMYRLTI
jgi:hypothetical protein